MDWAERKRCTDVTAQGNSTEILQEGFYPCEFLCVLPNVPPYPGYKL